MEPDLSVQIAKIKMKNPIMPASGTFGYGEEISNFIDLSELGAAVTKGITFEPRKGNPPPRIVETDAGMINSIGLQNPGVEEVIKEKIPFLKGFGIPIIINICGATLEEYVRLTERLNKVEGIAGVEVNISCPNTQKGGIAFGQDPNIAYETIFRIKKVADPKITIVAKLTPNVTNIVNIARAVKIAGADAISLINTVRARAKVRGKDETWLNGGLSGLAIKPIALKLVHEVAQANLGIPIIGIGGIRNVTDVLDFLECGADAVQVGTANFIDPKTMIKLISGLREYMKKKNYSNINELKKGERNGSER